MNDIDQFFTTLSGHHQQKALQEQQVKAAKAAQQGGAPGGAMGDGGGIMSQIGKMIGGNMQAGQQPGQPVSMANILKMIGGMF